MQNEGARRTGARPRRDLWALRTPIDALTGRLLSLGSLAVLLLLWTGITSETLGGGSALVGPQFLPAPVEVLRSLFRLTFDHDLLGSVLLSTVRIAKALALTVAVAVPLGILMGSFDVVNRVFEPIMAPMRYLPITAFVPLSILWFSIYEKQKVAFLFVGTVVYLLPAVVDAIRLVPDELVQTAYTLGASRWQVIRTVLIPAALPQIFDGFRVMNAIAWTYIILAEMVNASAGIGYILNLAQKYNKPEWSFAGILVVGVIGIVSDRLIGGLNRLLFSWREVDV
jgi:NitT/TauT family transport system permease protein